MAVSTATSKRVRSLHYSVTRFILQRYLDNFLSNNVKKCVIIQLAMRIMPCVINPLLPVVTKKSCLNLWFVAIINAVIGYFCLFLFVVYAQY
jgi:hypothetical protein